MKVRLIGLLTALAFVGAVVLFVAPGCTQSPGCFIEDQVATMASAVIVKELQCGNADAVNVSIHEILGKAGLCGEKQKTGPIADVFCPIVTAQVVDALAGKAIPQEWACNPNQAAGKLSAILMDACRKIPVFGPPESK